jgi:hypothetical protein
VEYRDVKGPSGHVTRYVTSVKEASPTSGEPGRRVASTRPDFRLHRARPRLELRPAPPARDHHWTSRAACASLPLRSGGERPRRPDPGGQRGTSTSARAPPPAASPSAGSRRSAPPPCSRATTPSPRSTARFVSFNRTTAWSPSTPPRRDA